jgi:hypothetical protein
VHNFEKRWYSQTLRVNHSKQIKTRHKIGAKILEHLGLTHVLIVPGSDGSHFCYFAWNTSGTRNGCPPIERHGKVRTTQVLSSATMSKGEM